MKNTLLTLALMLLTSLNILAQNQYYGNFTGNGLGLTNVNNAYAFERFSGKLNGPPVLTDSGQPWQLYHVTGSGLNPTITNGVLTCPPTNSTSINAGYASIISTNDIIYMSALVSFTTNNGNNTATSSGATFCGFTSTNPGSFWTDSHISITPVNGAWGSISNGSIISPNAGSGTITWSGTFTWGINQTNRIEIFRYPTNIYGANGGFGLIHGPDGIYYKVVNTNFVIGSVSNTFPTFEPFQNNPSTELLPQFSDIVIDTYHPSSTSPSANDLALIQYNSQGSANYGNFATSIAVGTPNSVGNAFRFANPGRSDFLFFGTDGANNNQLAVYGGGYEYWDLFEPRLVQGLFTNGLGGDTLNTVGLIQSQGGYAGSTGAAVHIPVAVSVTSSVFHFTNNCPNAIEVYVTDAAAYSVAKNGVTVFSSLAGNDYILLQPTNTVALTYASTAPTMTTNAW